MCFIGARLITSNRDGRMWRAGAATGGSFGRVQAMSRLRPELEMTSLHQPLSKKQISRGVRFPLRCCSRRADRSACSPEGPFLFCYPCPCPGRGQAFGPPCFSKPGTDNAYAVSIVADQTNRGMGRGILGGRRKDSQGRMRDATVVAVGQAILSALGERTS